MTAPTTTTTTTDALPAGSGAGDLEAAGRREFLELVQGLDAVVWEMDARTLAFTFVSRKAEALLGYPVERWLRDPAFWQDVLVHPEDRDWVLDYCAEANRAARDHEVVFRARRADGEVLWLRALVRVACEAGRSLLLRGVMIDVTKEREAVERLREREAQLEEAQATAGLGSWEWDIVADRITWSDELFRLHGREPGPQVDYAWYVAGLHPEDRERVQGIVAQALKSGDAFEFPHRIVRLDGEVRWLYGRGRVVRGADGRAIRMSGTSQDITERRQAEEALLRAKEELELRVEERTAELRQATEAAEQANRAKSEFLSRMSHELRTPMNSILGFAQLLARAELTPQHSRGVQHILKAGRHLLQLINEVLEIARIEAGRQALSLEPVRVRSVLEEVLALVRPLAAQVHVEVECPAPTTEVFVRADRQRLAQVLLNLLSNAIKYNRPGGRVRLSVETTASGDDGRVVLRVEDTGRGIPAERVGQLFTPFSRLGAESTDVEGTGLGLALSERLSEAMGGSLVLERTGVEGSVFRLEMERAESPLGALDEGRNATMGRLEEAPHAPATLLYVEDNLANLSLVETILLSRPRWRTIPALQGKLGLELAREHSPDLVLLDLHLPDLPGEEVLKRLRQDEKTARMPVVVISADATTATVERLKAAGVAAFLTKPLDVDEFLATLERLLPAPEPA